jgi:hypothetical protein
MYGARRLQDFVSSTCFGFSRDGVSLNLKKEASGNIVRSAHRLSPFSTPLASRRRVPLRGFLNKAFRILRWHQSHATRIFFFHEGA